MTQHFSCIGDPDEPPFQWDRPNPSRYRIGNLPKRILPANHGDLPVRPEHLIRLAEAGGCEVRQLDWGAWAAEISGSQLADYFAGDPTCAALMAALEPDRLYLLVAAEGV